LRVERRPRDVLPELRLRRRLRPVSVSRLARFLVDSEEPRGGVGTFSPARRRFESVIAAR
jgi:hypothetical protein